MAVPNKKKIDKLKRQDKELAKLPSINAEKRRFEKGEGLLKKLLKPKRIEVDLKEMESARKSQLRKSKGKAAPKAKARKKR